MSSTSSTAMKNLFSTQNNVTKVTFEIDNFKNATNAQIIKGFSLSSNDKINFSLCCFPNYFNKNYFGAKYVMIFLTFESSCVNQVTVRYRLSILNANEVKCETQEGVKRFSRSGYEMHGANLMILRDYLIQQQTDLLVDDKLTIYCEVKQIDERANYVQVKQGLSDNQMAQDYKSLLESGKYSDASLIVKIGDKKFLVHKNILSARSKVFAAMFENDCKEKRQNRVEIIDISVEVCELMLSYIYTGQIPDLSECAYDLFVAADKYELDHLKTVCQQHLGTTLSIESVANALLVADMHQATFLKSKCIDYITDNMTKVMATEEWKVLTATRIELTLELLKQMAVKANC